MDVVVGSGALFQGKDKLKSSQLMFDSTVANPTRTPDTRSVGIKSKVWTRRVYLGEETQYDGTYRPTYELLPSAFSTCGDYTASVHDAIKNLGRLKAEMDDEYLTAKEAGKFAIQASETGKLRRRLSLAMQIALANRTLRYVRR